MFVGMELVALLVSWDTQKPLSNAQQYWASIALGATLVVCVSGVMHSVVCCLRADVMVEVSSGADAVQCMSNARMLAVHTAQLVGLPCN